MNIREAIDEIRRQPQVQCGLSDQFVGLRAALSRLGLSQAVGYIDEHDLDRRKLLGASEGAYAASRDLSVDPVVIENISKPESGGDEWSLSDELATAARVANRLGLYDAADFLNQAAERRRP